MATQQTPKFERTESDVFQEIDNRFGFHPATDDTRERHQNAREAFIAMAQVVVELVPKGREQALALTALQEAAMWTNAGIACNLAPLKLGE